MQKESLYPKPVTRISTLNMVPAAGDEQVIAEVWAHHPDGTQTQVADVLARQRKLVICVYGTHPAPELPAAAFIRALELCMEEVRKREELEPDA